MEKVPLPLKLDLNAKNKSNNWKIFLQMWKNYELATDLQEATNEKRVATLLSIVGKEALELYNTFQWENESDAYKIDKVIEKFQDYFNPKKNVVYDRFILNKRKQRADETIDQYVTQLRLLADSCEYANLKESIIRDVMVVGIIDNKLRESLLRDCDLTLEKALQISRATEQAKAHCETIREDEEEYINEIKRNKTRKTDEITCKFCNRKHEMNREKCPAFGKTCNICSKRNHFAAVCKNKEVKIIDNNLETENDNENDDLYIE